MSNRRYLDISSTFRDRSQYPLPGEFIIPFSDSGSKGKIDALDPVSLATPFQSWQSNEFILGGGASLSVTVVSVISDGVDFVVSATSGSLQQIDNYYTSATANNTTLSEIRRISTYKFIGNNGVSDLAEISIYTKFGDNFAIGDTITISDPTVISTTSPFIFVPNGRLGENAYGNDCILYNETVRDYRDITRYSNITSLLHIDTSTPLVGWSATDKFNIRKSLPSAIGTLTTSTINSVTFPLTFPTTVDLYRGDFVRITSGVSSGEIRRIVKYTPSRVATVTPYFSTSPGAVNFEILSFSYDNVTPLSYSGSIVSQQQEVCYEIELINLILPNKNLESSLGSRIAFYPYVYVELVNVSGSSAGVKSILYSNNPSSQRMLFKAAIDDIQNPTLSSFVKIDGNGTVQTIKFKPNDSLKFSVRFSNGEVYQTVEVDNFSPLQPMEELQISALFSLKRL